MDGGQSTLWRELVATNSAQPQSSNCTHFYPVYDRRFVATLTAAVVITSLLSVFGSALIIFTYAAFKNLRTIAREILVQLSVADIIVAVSHIVGITANLPRFIPKKPCEQQTDPASALEDDIACKVQGGVTLFGTISSFLWTIAVAVYLLTIIVFERQRFARWLRFTFYPICWGIPLSLVIWFAAEDYLGFEESIDIGWCYIKWVNGSREGPMGMRRNVIPPVFGYELWLYLTFIVLPLLYIWIRCYIRVKISQVHDKSTKLHAKAKMADFKLTFVPLVFLLLRMWSLVLAVPHCYLPPSIKKSFRTTTYNAVLVLISGIGTSAQGLMNSILFCACTPVVRKHLGNLMRRIFCSPCKKNTPRVYALKDSHPISSREIEDTTDDDDNDRPQSDGNWLLVNTDPYDTMSKSHLLGEDPVVFNYQSIVPAVKE